MTRHAPRTSSLPSAGTGSARGSKTGRSTSGVRWNGMARSYTSWCRSGRARQCETLSQASDGRAQAAFLSSGIVRGLAACGCAARWEKSLTAIESRPGESQKSVVRPRLPNAIEVGRRNLDPYVGPVHRPRAATRLQVPASTLPKVPGVGLHLAERGGAAHHGAAVLQHECGVAPADREDSMPAQRPRDHLGGEVPTFEHLTKRLRHLPFQPAAGSLPRPTHPGRRSPLLRRR